MGVVGAMIRKDLRRQLRTPMAMLFALAFPLVFTALLALTFGSGSESAVPRVKLLIEDLDDSVLSGVLVSAAASDRMERFFDVQQVLSGGLERIERNEASALWRIPEGFQEDLLAGRPVTFELVRNPAQSVLPEIAEQGLAVVADLLSTASRVLREPVEELHGMLGDKAAPGSESVARLAVALYDTIEQAEPLIAPPAITLESIQLTDESGRGESSGPSRSAIFLLVLPGISVWALFLVGDIAMRDLLTEQRLGTLRRQLCGPITAGRLVAAKALYTAIVSLVSLVVLASIGWSVTGRTVDPLGFIALSAALILAITGYASVVYGAATTERQGATLSSVFMLVFAFLGGSFVPLASLPAAVRRIAPFTPFYWGNTGYQNLIRDGVGPLGIAPHAAVLGVLGGVLLVAGAGLMRRKVARGAA